VNICGIDTNNSNICDFRVVSAYAAENESAGVATSDSFTGIFDTVEISIKYIVPELIDDLMTMLDEHYDKMNSEEPQSILSPYDLNSAMIEPLMPLIHQFMSAHVVSKIKVPALLFC
jgi:hypothetical protein